MIKVNLVRKQRIVVQFSNVLKRYNSHGTDQPSNVQQDDGVKAYNDDFYGIKEITNKDIAGEYVMEKGTNVITKYSDLNKARTALDNVPTTKYTSFGAVRLDGDNMPKYHGQFDPSNKKLLYNVEQEELRMAVNKARSEEEKVAEFGSKNDLNPIEGQFFGQLHEHETEHGNKAGKAEEEPNFIDGQYFEQFFPPTNAKNRVKHEVGKFDFTFGKEFFDKVEKQSNDASLSRSQPECSKDWYKKQEAWEKSNRRVRTGVEVIEGIKLSATSPLKSFDQIGQELDEIRREQEEAEFKRRVKEELNVGQQSEDEKTEIKRELPPKPRTAFEYVQQLKANIIEPEMDSLKKNYRLAGEELFERTNHAGKQLDSKGYRSYKDAVYDLSSIRRSELLWFLKKSIVFNDCGIVAINKPAGLRVQGTVGNTSCTDPILFDLLPDFSELLTKYQKLAPGDDGKPVRLHTIHRLDKEVTGVLLLATNQDTARRLHDLFSKRLVDKTYWAITRNVPTLPEGIIDIPIEEGIVNGLQRMVLRPELEEELRRIAAPSRQAKRAVTNYRVLDSGPNSAVVEVKPETGLKHQIRVHLGFGLRCPVLGDHKYSYMDKIAPQRLPSDMLVALNVRQTKVRNMPMHLHAQRLILPEMGRDGSNLFIRAPIPTWFRETMSSLKLRP